MTGVDLHVHMVFLQDIKSHLTAMKLNPVKIKKPDSSPRMCYINFGCEEERQVWVVEDSIIFKHMLVFFMCICVNYKFRSDNQMYCTSYTC